MAINGLLTDVRWEWTGTEVTEDLLVDETILPVLDPQSITEGEIVWVASTGPYEVTETDVDAATLTITPGLTIDVDAGTEVARDIGGQPGQAWVCEVILPDADRPVEVPLTIHDLAVMPEGTYDPPVVILISDDMERVEDLPGSLPIVDGSYLVDIPAPEITDGAAPSSSPTPEVIPGIGAFYLRWVPPVNADPMRFEVHVSGDEGAGTGFTPDSTTFYSETSSYSMTLRNLPEVDTETGEPFPFDYDVPYYFKIIAKDDDGSAPASTGVSATMTQITGPDIAAKTILGENIVGSTLTGDLFSSEITLGSTISTGALDDSTDPPTIVGARVELGPTGLRVVDSAGNDVFFVPLDSLDSAFIRANFNMLSATVEDNFTMFGQRNQIAVGSALALSSGVTPPTGAPTVSWLYDTVQLDVNTAVGPHVANPGFNLGTFKLDPSQITAMAWDSTWSAWVVVQQKSGGFRIWRFTSTGAIYNNLATGRPWVDDYNDRTLATCAYGDGPRAETTGLAFMFKSGGDWYAWTPTEINRIPDSWIVDAAARPPCIGYDNINDRWVIAQTNGGGSGTLHIRRFTINNYSGSGPFPNASSDGVWEAEAGSGRNKRTHGVYIGVGDFGGSRYVHSVDEWLTTYVYSTSGVERDDEGTFEEWPKSSSALGFAFDGTAFGSVDAGGKITKYTTWNWTSVNSKSWLGLSAYDSDTAGVSSGTAAPHTGQTAGQHETPVGTIFEFDMKRRSKLVITVPKTQDSGGVDDPDKWKVYWSRQTTKPTLASHFKYAGQAGSPSALTQLAAITSDPTGVAPPGGIVGTVGAVNNFPGGVPASLYSAGTDAASNELIELKGDGSGRTGPAQWNSSGDVTMTPVPLGTVLMHAGLTAPPGFLLCQGQAVSRTTYAKLFAVIGTYFGVGDGSTTFNLPNLINRFPFGAGGSRVVGGHETDTGGSGSAALGAGDWARMDHIHAHGAAGLSTAASNDTMTRQGGSNSTVSHTNHTHNVVGSTGNKGLDDSQTSYHAMLALNFIIKALPY